MKRTLLERRHRIVRLLVRLRLVERDRDGDHVLNEKASALVFGAG